MSKQWHMELTQGGIVVAGGSGPTERAVMEEAAHYAMIYGQDGPVDVMIWQGARPKKKPRPREPGRG